MRLALALAVLVVAGQALAGELPPGFAYLSDIDPTIRQDVRYASSDNFLGRPVKGYAAPECILAEKAARALAKVQAALSSSHETLVVIDCYRPRRAVADMVEWSRRGKETNPRWYPDVRRNQLITQGYLAKRSGHSRGSTVDLTIAPIDTKAASSDPACGVRGTNTLDFGTGVDCMSPASATASKRVPVEARQNRMKLVALMRQQGFKNYAREWWHFTLIDEPFSQPFDFEVTAK